MAVSITGNSGSGAHGGSLTLTGSGFGTKSTAAPVIWDNCDHTVNDPAQIVAAGWTGAWPDAGTTAYHMQYRNTNYRTGMGAPHSRVGKYMAGAHGENVGYNQGYNVIVFKSRTVSAFPADTYASWWYRNDDAWVFGLNEGDNNQKCYDWSNDPSPMSVNTWYDEYNGHVDNNTSSIPEVHIFDDDANFDISSSVWWGTACMNPTKGQWCKKERFITHSQTNGGGRIKIVEDNDIKFNTAMRTDAMTGTTRSDGIGGFSRNSGNGNNYVYFADLYLDHTLQHVCLGNASTHAACTILEVCPPTAWNDTSVTVEVNRGVHADGATVYGYIYDATGTPNSNAFQLSASSPLHMPPGVMGVRRWN